ncbi:PREDICTED: uncharacterized protein LOC106784446 [Polistes canadensis]|uniref:uncharacterized protein LOC106784446 n=1 Tax=Polistes canadensis TaxID=91411 RepID=UPI000718DC83|nr:PREDICTED: uncharacterized protein LOC106784446 [Polistes canadensis]XP_014599472.1 PREDICTED: uncharacterized protein LOC106784446 [Polistes canadensis]
MNFVKEYLHDSDKHDLSLNYAYPVVNNDQQMNSVIIRNGKSPREKIDKISLIEDGLYTSSNPFTRNVTKPYLLNNISMLDHETTPKLSGKLIEIAIRSVNIYSKNDQSEPSIEITSVSLLFRKKVICKTNKPFNRKLHKLLLRNSERNNLSIEVYSKDGQSTVLPLPLPKHSVTNNNIEIEFGIADSSGKIHSGTVVCTVSLILHCPSQEETNTTYLHRLSNDPNDPQNALSLHRPRKNISNREIKYFLLEDPALRFDNIEDNIVIKKKEGQIMKPPDVAVIEQPILSLLDLSFRNLLQARRPLRPSSNTHRHHTIGKALLSVTILRGVEIPIREESALVQPLLEVDWGGIIHTTPIADGPAPIWHQTMHFELLRKNEEYNVKLRLYDQHPIWGQQWLGEARIPLEHHRNYQELERWVALSPLCSPKILFGYVQASPGHSHTRIYTLIKLELPGNAKLMEDSTINTLLKNVQRCLLSPYKITDIQSPEEAAKLVMLLPEVPNHYGPLTPRQALNANKVDHYGRAVLLASLLESFGSQTYVLLGSSQTSKYAAFVLSIEENTDTVIWDPETSDHYKLDDSRSPLIKVSHLVNYSGIWENLQKSILAHNLKYDVKSSKDWRPIGIIAPSTSERTVQVLELNVHQEEEEEEDDETLRDSAMQMEQQLRDKFSHWRSSAELTTIYNRHAIAVLRNYISKIEDNNTSRQPDKKDLKQLYRAYYMHGFILNLRQSSLEDLIERLASTKTHNVTGPVEFAIVYHIKRYIGKTNSIWLAVAVLRSRD